MPLVPVTLAQALGSLGGLAGVLSVGVAIFTVIFNKRVRTPADKRGDLELVLKSFETQLARADREKEALAKAAERADELRMGAESRLQTERIASGEQYEASQKKIRELYAEQGELYELIREKDDEIDDLKSRLQVIARKLARNEEITPRDLLPQDPEKLNELLQNK